MRLRLRRTGGVAGMALDSGVIESEALAGEHAEALRALAGGAAAGPPAPPGRGQPDRFTYELTVDDRTVVVKESELTPALRALVKDIERHSRERR